MLRDCAAMRVADAVHHWGQFNLGIGLSGCQLVEGDVVQVYAEGGARGAPLLLFFGVVHRQAGRLLRRGNERLAVGGAVILVQN